jgi:hypothetical protein
LDKVINGFKIVEFQLDDLFRLWVVWFEFLILPLLADVSVFEPDDFVAKFLISHQSLDSGGPHFDPAIVVLGDSSLALIFPPVVDWGYPFFAVFFQSV